MTLGNLSSGAECFGFIWLLCYRSFSFAFLCLEGLPFREVSAIVEGGSYQRCTIHWHARSQLHASDFEDTILRIFQRERNLTNEKNISVVVALQL